MPDARQEESPHNKGWAEPCNLNSEDHEWYVVLGPSLTNYSTVDLVPGILLQ